MKTFKMGLQAMKEVTSIIGVKPEALVSGVEFDVRLDDVVRIKVEFIVTEEQWRQIGIASEAAE